MREPIEAARTIQRERLAGTSIQTNAGMGPGEIRQFCPLDQTSTNLLKSATQQMQLSARAYHRILKLARTIADLAGEANIKTSHVAEAIQYRPAAGSITSTLTGEMNIIHRQTVWCLP